MLEVEEGCGGKEGVTYVSPGVGPWTRREPIPMHAQGSMPEVSGVGTLPGRQ